MFNQLIEPLAGAELPPHELSESDCRVYERHACGLVSSCQPASTFGKEDLKWPSTIDNVSVGGIGLILARRFEKGTGLAIELPGNATKSAYTVLAKVVSVHKHGGAAWMLGCKF